MSNRTKTLSPLILALVGALIWKCGSGPEVAGNGDTPFTDGGGGAAGSGGTSGTIVDGGGGADTDGDGIPDSEEGGDETDTDGDGTPDYKDTDADGDGISDRDETIGPKDFDEDSKPNHLDTDSDGDGIDDEVEGLTDGYGDGWPDFVDEDSDQDGISDAVEGDADTDGDGVLDFRDEDSDADGMSDVSEGGGDNDGDGIPNFKDTFNDGEPPAISFTQISTEFNNPIGIDYHEPTNTIVVSVNYPAGAPRSFERIELDGSHEAFSDVVGLTDEVKIATARPDSPGGFIAGDLFVGNGLDGQITRITDNGATTIDPWVDLPGDGNGLMRGSLFVDRTGDWGGDLIAVTTSGQVWRIDSAGTPTHVVTVGVHLEGCVVVPNAPVRFGPLAGKVIAGAEGQGLLYAVGTDGSVENYSLGVNVEDIDLIGPHENYFGVNFGTKKLLGAAAAQFEPMVGDILLTQEMVTAGQSGLYRLQWNGADLVAQPIPVAEGSATVAQWEHVTFAGAGINEVQPPPDPPGKPPPPDPPL